MTKALASASTTHHEFIRLTPACERYPLSKSTLRRKIANGELTAYRLGRRIVVVDVAELDALFVAAPGSSK